MLLSWSFALPVCSSLSDGVGVGVAGVGVAVGVDVGVGVCGGVDDWVGEAEVGDGDGELVVAVGDGDTVGLLVAVGDALAGGQAVADEVA